MTKPLIGELLIKEGVISENILKDALEVQHREGGLIGMILLNLGAISEKNLLTALTKQTRLSIS